MQFSILASALLCTGAALALPAPTSPSNVLVAGQEVSARGTLQKRANVRLDIYADLNATGRYEGLWSEENFCHSLQNGWNDQITSIALDYTGWECKLYVNAGCREGDFVGQDALKIRGKQIYPDLRQQNYDDRISSYRCYRV